MPHTARAWLHALPRPRRAVALLLLLAHALTVSATPLPSRTPSPAEHDTITAVPACRASGCCCGDAVKTCCCCAHEPTGNAPPSGPSWDCRTCHGAPGALSIDLTTPAVVTCPALVLRAAPPLVGVLRDDGVEADAVADAPDSPPPR